MAENLLFPAYIKVDAVSAQGAHSGLIPTREWSATPLVPLNVLGSYTNWSGFPCDGEEMVESLLNALAAFNPATTIYSAVTVYTLDTPTSPAIPRASKAYSIAGTMAVPGWAKATMRTWVFRDTEWSIAKLVQLDTGTDNNWNATTDITGNANAIAVRNAFTSLSWAWASRNGERPNTLMKVTIKLSDKLREQYGMA